MNEYERSPGTGFSHSLSVCVYPCVCVCVSPESSASKRSGCKNQSGAMKQAAPQLANHRFEHQKRGGAVRLPATLSKQPSSHAAILSSPLLHPARPQRTVAHSSALHSPRALPNFNLRRCGFFKTTPPSSALGHLFFFQKKKKKFLFPLTPTEQLPIFGSLVVQQ